RQGKWEESIANLKKASELDPKSSWPLQNLAFNYQMVRDYPAAQRTIDRALELSPKSFELWGLKIEFAIEQRGDFSEYERAIALMNSGAQSSPGVLTAPSAADLAKDNALTLTHMEAARLDVLISQRRYQQ